MKLNTILTFVIAIVWMVNGLFCKVLNFTPRHEKIVGTILTFGNPRILTVLIGLLEICMAIWVLSGLWKRINAITQIVVIGSMNFLEQLIVPDLLLWGRMNALFALIFMCVIFLNEFYFRDSRFRS